MFVRPVPEPVDHPPDTPGNADGHDTDVQKHHRFFPWFEKKSC